MDKDDKYFQRYFGARKNTILRLKDLYEKEYFEDTVKNSLREEMYKEEFKRINKYFDMSNGGNILDIGCGEGYFLALFDKNWNKYGIELSDHARENAEKRGVITEFELQDNFFDLIIFRGTIQHIPDPISRIGECYYWLKDTGGIVFLATPNINSISYKLFDNLPMLSKKHNFLLPSDKMLEQILSNFGFNIITFEYPYSSTPYASPIKDTFAFILRLLKIKKEVDFPFYKNVLECYARKGNK
jgi:SAM-dependent methyltransferase